MGRTIFFSLGGKSLFLGADRGGGGRGEEKAIGNGSGCLSYLLGVKISDLVPFTLTGRIILLTVVSSLLTGARLYEFSRHLEYYP